MEILSVQETEKASFAVGKQNRLLVSLKLLHHHDRVSVRYRVHYISSLCLSLGRAADLEHCCVCWEDSAVWLQGPALGRAPSHGPQGHTKLSSCAQGLSCCGCLKNGSASNVTYVWSKRNEVHFRDCWEVPKQPRIQTSITKHGLKIHTSPSSVTFTHRRNDCVNNFMQALMTQLGRAQEPTLRKLCPVCQNYGIFFHFLVSLRPLSYFVRAMVWSYCIVSSPDETEKVWGIPWCFCLSDTCLSFITTHMESDWGKSEWFM